MRLVEYIVQKPDSELCQVYGGVLLNSLVIDLTHLIYHDKYGGPTVINIFLAEDEYLRNKAQIAVNNLHGRDLSGLPYSKSVANTNLIRPLNIKRLRDFYAFEQHVKTANQNRGRDVPKEWYEFPVFYFSNANAIYGPEDTIPYPSHTEALDYELEVACVIGKAGRDIPADQAEEHIFGYMIFNDWSARDVQKLETRVGLGPAKAKDFANSFGPYLVTPDELADRHMGRPGVYDLPMMARVNGVERSRGNWKDLHWSFGQMIERASQDVTLQPGDVIGSGTVGTGCLLELTKGEGPWLQPGDVVELEVERLGILRNVIGEKKPKGG